VARNALLDNLDCNLFNIIENDVALADGNHAFMVQIGGECNNAHGNGSILAGIVLSRVEEDGA
jgi:hypothetical protein